MVPHNTAPANHYFMTGNRRMRILQTTRTNMGEASYTDTVNDVSVRVTGR